MVITSIALTNTPGANSDQNPTPQDPPETELSVRMNTSDTQHGVVPKGNAAFYLFKDSLHINKA